MGGKLVCNGCINRKTLIKLAQKKSTLCGYINRKTRANTDGQETLTCRGYINHDKEEKCKMGDEKSTCNALSTIQTHSYTG